MKLKQSPDDFRVEEVTDVVPVDRGPFAFYRLEKRGWSTPDALSVVRRRWKIEPRQLSYGGLKDRHAATVQYLTIFHGPRRSMRHHEISVEYLGQITQPYTSTSIRANRFAICLRDLTPAEAEAAGQALDQVRADGVPNYFDDQRFGSVASGGEFVARLMILGQFEDALRLALTGPYEFDRAEQKQEKATLREHWGNWQTLKEKLPRGHARSLIDYLLHHPGDFRDAVARLRPELRGLYLSAYQSHLWNRMLAHCLRENCRPEQLLAVQLRLSEVPMHRNLGPEQRQALAKLALPLPSARMRLAPDDQRLELVNVILAQDGLELRQMKIKGIRELFFSKGERAALCLPVNLRSQVEPDERHRGRQALALAFELPRGSYATLIVKRIATESTVGD
jgi:tRNA pseudouridine13 synthase